MKIDRLLLSAAVAALTTSSALAHRFWIVSSTSVLSGEEPWACFDAAVSNDLFFPNHHAPELEAFTAVGPEGETTELQHGMVGKYRTTFDIQLKKPGTYRVSTVRSTLSARWEEAGEQKRWRGSVERIAEVKDKPGVMFMDSRSRVETFVTSGEPTTPAASGKGLELVFDKSHPNDLFTGETSTFTLHNNGKPAAGLKVTIIKGADRYRNDVGEITATTDENGNFTVAWPEAGRFWMNVSTEGGTTAVAGLEAQSRSSYTATFEVLPE